MLFDNFFCSGEDDQSEIAKLNSQLRSWICQIENLEHPKNEDQIAEQFKRQIA